MSLSPVTNPVSGTEQIFAGFQPIEFIFKREDLAVTGVVSGAGGAKINHAGDLTSYLSVGDIVYLYSEGTNHTYDGSGTITAIVAGEITIDTAYIESATGGYINYLKNYYVEMKLVDETFDTADLLGFSLESDGDAAGNISIDVSIINDLNTGRGEITTEQLSDGLQEFEVKYREVHLNSSNSFTLIDNKLLIVVYATEQPETEAILNNFDLPNLYLGYPSAIAIAHSGGSVGDDIEVTYNELDINNIVIGSGSLGVLDSGLNGFLIWEWLAAASVSSAAKFIEFDIALEAGFDFIAFGFDHPDFLVQ